jgi:hypothetical protein
LARGSPADCLTSEPVGIQLSRPLGGRHIVDGDGRVLYAGLTLY